MELLRTTARSRGRRAARRLCRVWLLAAMLLGCGAHAATGTAASAQASISDEYQLKAVFLFNFAQFVEWPARAFPEPQAPIIIGVLGDDPFGPYLDDLVSGEKVHDRPLVIHRFKRVADLGECHLLFISRSDPATLEKALAILKGRSVLTLSDADTFTRLGGMVRFATENGKIRLKINVEAAKACGLTISSKIIRPATIVTTGKD